MSESDFALELRKRMAGRRIKGAGLAALTGICQPQISDYVIGKHLPSAKNMEKIAAALDWPLQDALHAAGRHMPALDAAATDIGAQLADIVNRLDPPEQRALCVHLRHVALSWVSSVKGKVTLNEVLRFFAPNCPSPKTSLAPIM